MIKIYQLFNNHQYTDLSFIHKEDVRRFSYYKGQKIEGSWNPDIFTLSDDRLQKGKTNHFDARCYGSTLIVHQRLVKDLVNFLGDTIQHFPVNITGLTEKFAFINLTHVLPAINFDNLNMEESMAMLRNKRIHFRPEVTEGQILFRDQKIASYFCTDKFVNFADTLSITGLRFDQVAAI